MAQGFSIPMKANSKGRVVLSSGDQHLSDLLATALGSGDSDNPFQEPGLGEYMIFENATEDLFQQDVTVKIEEIFEAFEEEELAKLQDREDNLKISMGEEEGAWEMTVYYINLERDTSGTLKVFSGRAGGVQVEVL